MQTAQILGQRLAVVLLVGSLVVTGCSKKQAPQESQTNVAASQQGSGSAPSENPVEPMNPSAPVAESVAPGRSEESSQPVEIPKVVMAEIDRAKCNLFVGDSAPHGELSQLSGGTQQISDLFGKKATVLVFWTSGAERYAALNAVNLLGDMQSEIESKYRDQGVAVVGIHVGPKSEETEKIIQESGANFTILIDTDGGFFRQFSAHQPPCLYLLDGSGRIVWLDVEYSRSAREALKQAVKALSQ